MQYLAKRIELGGEEATDRTEENVRRDIDLKKHHRQQKGNTILTVTTDGIVEIRLERERERKYYNP